MWLLYKNSKRRKKTLYVEMDDDFYYFEIDFDTMAEIVDYLREQNNKQQGYENKSNTNKTQERVQRKR